METRAAAKRKATALPTVVVEKQHPKRQRVVLGEVSNLPDLNVPASFNLSQKEKLQCPKKNLNVTKPTATKNTHPSQQNGEPYVSSIYEYLGVMEIQKKRRPMIDYMEKIQREVTTTMRAVLVDWKYEEIDPPRVEAFCNITDNTYDKGEVVKMEADILKTLNFEMGNPTVKTFLTRFADAAYENKKGHKLQIQFLGCYLAELSLLDYDCLRFLPSVVAASAIFLARFIIWPEVHPWISSLCDCTGYKPADLKECVLILHDLYLSRKAGSFRAARDKYKQQKFKCVANLPSPPFVPSCYLEDQ